MENPNVNTKEDIDQQVPFLCKLEELSKRELLDGKIKLDIPKLQRGLVWNPAQVEVLWDSLMRGIPIGNVTLIKYSENSKLRRENHATHGIFDGQQRTNAIKLGFDNPFHSQEEAYNVLWLDLLPSRKNSKSPSRESKSPSREFYFYLTTSGQPWGYKINDYSGETQNSLLNTNERCAGQKEICYKKPSVLHKWPHMAGLPIPFAILWGIESLTVENLEAALKPYENFPWYAHYKSIKNDLNEEQLGKLTQQLQKIKKGLQIAHHARVIVVVAPDTFDLSQENANDDQSQDCEKNSDIAVFFARLNRGGTTPSLEDMNYSILKSIAPDLATIDHIAEERMPPARLAALTMRLYMTELSSQWKGDINRKDVYSLANDNKFHTFVTEELLTRVQRLESLLEYRATGQEWGMPRVILSMLVHSNPNLYLFLLILSARAADGDSRTLVAACMLAGLLATNLSYKDSYTLISAPHADMKTCVQNWLYHSIRTNQLTLPAPPCVFASIVDATKKMDKDALEKAWNPPHYKQALNQIWYWKKTNGRILLLYALRNYIESKFEGYNPALSVWQEDNRPWDYDHIFPQSWVISGQGRRQGEWHYLVNEFIHSIGNIAPISFSVNRSKSDAPPFAQDYYLRKEEDEALYCTLAEEDKDIYFLKNAPTAAIENDKNNAFRLAHWIAKRLEKMYREWYTSLQLQDLLDFSVQDEKRQTLMKRFREVLSSYLPEQEKELQATYSIIYTGEQKEISSDPSELSFPWLACGLKVQLPGNGAPRALLCVCSNGTNVEWGLRRHPEDTSIAGDPRIWWVPQHLLSTELTTQLADLNNSGYLCRTKEMKDCQVEEIVNILLAAHNALK